MFTHYLIMAFRNLRKYKTRNIISIIGLAVGFVCFAFSALWVRYEMSYDNFHPKADRIYRVQMAVSKWNTSGSSSLLTNHTCQQRRKEIAIRKIAGAEVLDIIYIFFKENLLLLVLAALIAFPAGYVIMKRWLENYVKQTSMDAWLFVLIFLIVFFLILFSTISMVWKVANHNPSEEVMKGE